MAGQRQTGGAGRGGNGMRTGGGSGKSNVTKISNKKTMGKTEIKVRAKTDKVRKSPAAEDMRKGNLDNLKKTFGKPKVAKKNNSPFGPVAAGIVKPKAAPKKPVTLTTRGKVVATVGTGAAAVGTTKAMKKAGEKNAERIRKNKSKSVPVPRNPRKQ